MLHEQPLERCGTCPSIPFLFLLSTQLFLWVPPLFAPWSLPGSVLCTLFVLVSWFTIPPPTVRSYVLLDLEGVPLSLVFPASTYALLSTLIASYSYLEYPLGALWCSLCSPSVWGIVWGCWVFILPGLIVGPTHPLPTLSKVVRLHWTILRLHLLASPSPPFGVKLLISFVL